MNRILSIDVFRSVTMCLMIWVNDFWTLTDIPKWLKHAHAGEDYLGFSDLIFPWFLFVMGMSIPFSFHHRINKGETNFHISKHIIFRSIALLIMGLFHMNMEMYNHETSLISKPYYVIICTIAFFLIWNVYPGSKSNNKVICKLLPIIGVGILLVMFLIYQGKNYSGDSIGFKAHWWGILGLIGWSYLITGLSYLFLRKSFFSIIIMFSIFLGLNILNSSGIAYNVFSWQSKDWIPGSGGLQAMVLGGIITSLVLMKYKEVGSMKKLYSTFLGMGLFSLFLGLYLRQYYIISKISGTPTWILISLSSAIFLYILLHWIVDTRGMTSWYGPIKIAGTATLTCYLIPYFYNSLRTILNIQLPLLFTTGIIGLFKSIVYTSIIIIVAWSFTKRKVQLKI